ncbi:MAG: hypothetical protein SOW50_06175 [Lachnospiraceae bacterium]|nr:hypothetical protein [Lachnospiraceae bacterium]
MKKRNNRKGFSLPMSVLFMLVVIMLTLVLVTAALAAAKQVHKEKLQKQAELHVSSTAEVVADLILGMTFHMEVQNPGESGETTVMTVKNDNGKTEMANQIANLIALAENDATTKKSTSGLLSFEMGTMKIEGNVVVYSTKSDFFPGDMVISLTDKSPSTTGYTLAFRLDGQVDTSSGEYSFSDMTFYSGSEVYK